MTDNRSTWLGHGITSTVSLVGQRQSCDPLKVCTWHSQPFQRPFYTFTWVGWWTQQRPPLLQDLNRLRSCISTSSMHFPMSNDWTQPSNVWVDFLCNTNMSANCIVRTMQQAGDWHIIDSNEWLFTSHPLSATVQPVQPAWKVTNRHRQIQRSK